MTRINGKEIKQTGGGEEEERSRLVLLGEGVLLKIGLMLSLGNLADLENLMNLLLRLVLDHNSSCSAKDIKKVLFIKVIGSSNSLEQKINILSHLQRESLIERLEVINNKTSIKNRGLGGVLMMELAEFIDLLKAPGANIKRDGLRSRLKSTKHHSEHFALIHVLHIDFEVLAVGGLNRDLHKTAIIRSLRGSCGSSSSRSHLSNTSHREKTQQNKKHLKINTTEKKF